MENLQNFLKIPINRGSKIPAILGWSIPQNQRKQIDTNKYEVGIPTGQNNNLLVLDVDNKDNGLEEFDKFIKLFGDIETLTVKTPSGGIHLYFTYSHKDAKALYLIENSLINKAKYRGTGIDIRSNGGYIKAPPSKNYNIIKDVEIIEMPLNLIKWLLQDIPNNKSISTKKTKPKTQNKNKNETENETIEPIIEPKTNIKFDIDEDEIKTFLYKLPNKYLINYDDWLLVLTISKNLGLNYKIFDEWSKQEKKKYDKKQNLNLWNANKGRIDINYLILKLNQEDKLNLNFIPKYKFEPNSNQIINNDINKPLVIKEKFLNISNNIFKTHDTILINSTTGTSKTTNTATNIKQLMNDDKELKFLSIVNLIKLSEQQINTFEKQGVKLTSYQKATKEELKENNIVCCINSLLKLNCIIENIENYIVYIDEINAFIDTVLFSDALNSNLKPIYLLLMKIIKNCKKLIITDAHITEKVFILIKNRNLTKPNYIFINNEFKKYEGVKANKYMNENEFLLKMDADINNDNYFLFGTDSKSITSQYYFHFLNKYPDKQDKFILITAETNFTITNATKQFKNKWVFYSPSITTGIDFSIDTEQNAYLYIKGDTIRTHLSFQQATRTRNLKELNYFCSAKEKKPKFNNLEETRQYYKEFIELNNKIINCCVNTNEEEEQEVIENTFFNLFVDGIYNLDVENTNKLVYFEKILKEQGFIINRIGETKELLTKNKKNNMKDKYTEIKESNFEEFKNKLINEGTFDDINKKLYERWNLLNIQTIQIDEFKFLIEDEYNFNSFFNFSKLLKSDEYLNELKEQEDKLKIKTVDTTLNKILLLRQFERDNFIKKLDINFDESKPQINIPDDKFKLIKKVFRITKNKPSNIKELNKFYIGMLRNIIGNLEVIKTDSKTNTNNKNSKDLKYNWNEGLNKQLFEVNLNMSQKYFDDDILKRLKLELIDDEVYKFGKKQQIINY